MIEPGNVTTVELQKCTICDCGKLRPMPGFEDKFLHSCRDCGFVFTTKIPTEKELKDYYNNYSYDKAYYVSPITLKRYEEILQGLARYRKLNRLLDVGCGNGIFLGVAQSMGWEVYGVEFSQKGVAVCQENGLENVYQGTLEGLFHKIPEVDVVISIEVLEHINTPRSEVELFYRKLRNGGAVYLTTPNFNSLNRYLTGADYDVIAYPEHLSYFTRKTLRRLFQDVGFQCKNIQTTGVSLSRFTNSTKKNTKENPFVSESQDEKLRIASETRAHMRLLKKMANRLLDVTGTGLSLKGLFEKPSG